MAQNAPLGHAAQSVSTVAWATGLMAQKFLTTGANAASILLYQFTLAAALMWVALFLFNMRPSFSKDSLIRVIWGLLAPGAALIFSVLGAARTDGVSVALIYGFIPLIGPILAWRLLKEPLHFSFPLGAVISLVGLYAISAGRVDVGSATWLGNLLVFCGVLCACFSHVIGRHLNTGRVPWPQTATLQVSGAAVATLVLALFTGFDFPDWSNTANLGAIAYLVLVMTIINYLAFNLALANIRAAWVSMYSALVPVVGAIAAVIYLKTPLSIGECFGLLVVTLGVATPHLLRARNVSNHS